MAFLNVLFPEHISYGSKGGQTWSTHVTRVGSGHEYRNQNWSLPLWKMDVSYGIKDFQDMMELRDFFNLTRGRTHSFRFSNPLDRSSAGTGTVYDGSVTFADETLVPLDDGPDNFQFQLVRTYGGVTVDVTLPRADTVTVGIDGVLQTSGWSVDYTTGIITFSNDPEVWPAGVSGTVTAGFEYDMPMRFDIDELDMRFEDLRLLSASIPLVEVRL